MALTLNGSTGLSGIAGSAGTPALQGNNDANTGYFFGTDILGLSTAGSERLRIDSSGNLGLGTASPTTRLHVNSGSTNTAALFESTDTEVTIQLKDTTGSSYIKARNDFRFENSSTELMRIDSSGHLMIGTTTEGNASADDLTVATSGTTGITIRSGDTSTGNIYFSDATSGTGEFAGAIEYAHNGNSLRLHTNSNERLRITSAGALQLSDTNSPNDANTDIWVADDVLNFNAFGTNGAFIFKSGSSSTERLRIDSTGHLYIKGQNHEVRWYRDDEARYGAITYDGSNFNINNPVNDHTRVCKSDGTELVKFHNAGNVLIADGDLVISTAGHGIDFSATADGAGSSPDEVFDDYEEGNWTPSYDTSGATGTISNVTYATQVGKYVKIGKMVHIEGTLKTSAITKDQSGTYDIAGLPFPCVNSTAIGGVFTYLQSNWTNAPQSFDVVADTSRMRARQGIDVGSGTYTTGNTDDFNTGAGNNNRIYFSGQYRAQ